MKRVLPSLVFFFSCFCLRTNAQSAWTELGTGANALNANGFILQVLPDNNGNLYVIGDFNNGTVMKWDGSSWAAVGNLPTNYSVLHTIALDPSGNLYTAFNGNGGPSYVAKWDGTNWTNLGNTNFNHMVHIVATDNAGNVYASGYFFDGNNKNYVAKWDHTTNTWSELGTGANALNPTNVPNGGATLQSIVVDNSGNVYAAGHFRNNNGNGSFYVARWNGTTWSELGGTNSLNANGPINDLKIDADDNVYAAGDFTDVYGSTAVAKWNHTTNTWSILGILNSNAQVPSIALGANGTVYAPVYDYYNQYSHVALVARYNPNNNTWTEVDGTSNFFNYTVLAIATDASGHLYSAGAFTDGANNFSGSRFVAGITVGGVLPVHLISFTATKSNDKVICRWQTSLEQNADHYTIQRSNDGRQFSNIGFVNANSSSTQGIYSFTDVNAGNQNLSKTYYRLQMVDRDGSFSYSPVALVDWNSKNGITVYPVPVKDVLRITLGNSGDRNTLSVLDASGKLLLKKEDLRAGQAIELDVSRFKAGTYFLYVANEREHFTKTFIKD